MGPGSGDRGNRVLSRAALHLMETLQWGRDLEIAEIYRAPTTPKPLRRCFNGAAIWRSRKSWRADRGALPLRRASMGPRSGDRGNSRKDWTYDARSRGFNGAAIWRSRKYRDLADGRRRFRPLQWGRDLEIAEISVLEPADRRGARFNGAAIWRSRKYASISG